MFSTIGPPIDPPNWFFFVSGTNLPVSGSRSGLRERIARLQAFVLEELEHAAVELLRARLGLHGDDAGGRLAELGVVVLRGDLGLADRLEGGIDDDDAEDRVAVLGAVELIAGAAEVLAVDLVCVEPCGFSLPRAAS